MAEMEKEELDEVVNDNETPEKEEESPDEIDYETAIAAIKEAKELKLRLEKAEQAIVEKKREAKRSEHSEVYTKQDREIDRLVDKNPHLEGKEELLKSYLSKGNSIEEAKLLVENKDKTIKNRELLSKSGITEGAVAPSKRTFTKEELINLPQHEYNSVMKDIESGKIKMV